MFKSFLFFCFIATSIFAKQPIFVGIAGGTGAGKTTLAKKIYEAFPDATLISQDSYYKDRSDLSFEERDRLNFDHLDSLEFSLLKEHLINLKNGLAIEEPVYNFHTHSREKTSKRVEPSNIVLVEGILLLAAPEVRDLFDITIFVEADDDVRILRRVERDMKERSRDFNSVKTQYLETVKPMHDLFVAPSKKYANIIVPGDECNQAAIDFILASLRDGASQF